MDYIFKDTITIVIVISLIALMGMSSSILFYEYSTSISIPSPTVSIALNTATIPKNIVVIGGGSTFMNPQIQAWIQRFMDLNKGYNIVINYQSIGSGAGEAKLIDGAIDFAITDIPISKIGFERLKSRQIPFIQIPISAGAVAIVYNIPEWDENKCGPLRLVGEVIADIYLGKILRWNDPVIAQHQIDGCRNLLPDKEIIGVHRADGSGTTALFTAFLSIVSDEWRQRVGYGYTVEWPRDSIGYGIGARGSEGVAAVIRSTPYSIGYIEYGYAIALRLNIASIRNREGNFVIPNTTTIMSALQHVNAVEIPRPNEYWGELIFKFLYREGIQSYPIVGTPIMTIRLDLDPNKLYVVREYLMWILTEGQNEENIVVGCVPLPKSFIEEFLPIVKNISVVK